MGGVRVQEICDAKMGMNLNSLCYLVLNHFAHGTHSQHLENHVGPEMQCRGSALDNVVCSVIDGFERMQWQGCYQSIIT